MPVEVVTNITEIETIARGLAIRDLKRLRKQFGGLRWRKLKGTANVRLPNGWLSCTGMKLMGSAGRR